MITDKQIGEWLAAAARERAEAAKESRECREQWEAARVELVALQADVRELRDAQRSDDGNWSRLKGAVAVLVLLGGAGVAIASWALHGQVEDQSRIAQTETRITTIERDVEAHERTSAALHDAARRERSDGALAVRELTATIREWRAAQEREREELREELRVLRSEIRRRR